MPIDSLDERKKPCSTVILSTGANFPDALAAGPLAIAAGAPILLNDGDSVRPDVLKFLNDNAVARVIIVGGTAAVPQSVEDELELGLGREVVRLGGANRNGTAVEIAD